LRQLYQALSLLLAVFCAGSTVQTAGTPAPATLQGIVLYQDAALGLFVQAGGETVQVTGLKGAPLTPGDRVDVTGVTAEKDGRRTMTGAHVTRLGAGPLPPARAISTSGLATDESRDDWVSFVGVIQEVRPTPAGFDLRVAVDEAQVNVAAPPTAPAADRLVDADLQIRGVRVLLRSPQGIVMGVRILAPTVSSADVRTTPGRMR